MLHNGREAPPEADVVFVVETTALSGAYMPELVDNYIKPTLEYFSSPPAGGGGDVSQLGGRLSGSLFTLVTFTAGDGTPEPPVNCCLPVAAPEKLLFYLDNADFVGGNCDNASMIAEGLATALQCFDDLKALREPAPSTLQCHLVLVCNSLPLQLPVQETASFLGCGLDQLVAAVRERSVHLSVICPRRLGGIQKLFEQAGGDVALNHAKNYTRDPHHLVLLSGFGLQEQASGGQAAQQQQTQQPQQQLVQQQIAISAAMQQQQAPSSTLSQSMGHAGMMPLGQMSRAPTPPNQRSSPVPTQAYQQQLKPMLVRGQQLPAGMQQQQQRQPAPMANLGGLRQPAPPNVTVQTAPGQQAVLGVPPRWQPQQQQQQQQQQQLQTNLPGMPQTSTVPEQHSVLLSQLNKPTMAAGSQQNQPPFSLQQQQQNMQQGGPQMAGMMRPQVGRFVTQQQQAMVGQPGPSLQQPQQQQQQQQTRMMGPPVHPVKIWEGTLEWSEKKLGEASKSVHSIPCQLSCSTTASGEPEVKADNWPNKLMMQLINRAVISTIGKVYFENIRSVKFNLQPCEPLERLSQVMTNGSTGCVYFSSPTPTDVKVMMLLYTAEKQAFFGFIPNDQNGFIEKLKEVMAKQKQSMAHHSLRMRQQQQAQQQQQQAAAAAAAAAAQGGQMTGPRPGVLIQQTNPMTLGGGQLSQGDTPGGVRGRTPQSLAGPGAGPVRPTLMTHSGQFSVAGGTPQMQMGLPQQQQQQQVQQQQQQQQQLRQQQMQQQQQLQPTSSQQGLLATQLQQQQQQLQQPGQPQGQAERQQNFLLMRQLQQQLAQARQKEMQFKAQQEHGHHPFQSGGPGQPGTMVAGGGQQPLGPGLAGQQGGGRPPPPSQPQLDSTPGLRTLLQQSYRPQMLQRAQGPMGSMMPQSQPAQMQPQQAPLNPAAMSDDPGMHDFLN